MIMEFNELPKDIQEQLKRDCLALKNRNCNTSYHICFYNESGTRYFIATRNQASWHDGRGNYMPFGGGSQWKIKYGAMAFRRYMNPFGGMEWCLTEGKPFRKSANGTEIPAYVKTKAEVLDIIKKIGIFNV